MHETAGKTARSADGTDIYYETYCLPGQRPQLLLVHGIGGDLDAWQFVREPLLAAGYGVMALDLRGHGYSGHPRGWQSYTLERLGEDIASVLDAEGLQSAVVVGHSGGAVAALSFALAYPARVAGLVLISGSYGPPRSLRHGAVQALAAAGLSLAALITYRAPGRWHSPYPAGKVHKEVEWRGLVRTWWHNSLHSYALWSRLLMHINFAGSLGRLALPVLLVTGEADGIYPADDARLLHRRIKNSVLQLVPRANHVLPLNEPAVVAQAINDFLAAP